MDITSKKTLSLDHILVTIKDYAKNYENSKKLGFAPTQISSHPWGTATSFLVFQGNFIELIGMEDATKIGTNETNGFCFGRQIGTFLDKGEDGVSMIALHSKDTHTDYAELIKTHPDHQGIVDFRRTIRLEDGTPDEVVVTIGLLLDPVYTEASSFICHQHRPDLIWKDEWMVHPNGAIKMEAITYLADDMTVLRDRWQKEFGHIDTLSESEMQVNTHSGWLRAMSSEQFARQYQGIALPESHNPNPHVAAITISTATLDTLTAILDQNGVTYHKAPSRVLIAPEYYGNILIEFVPWQAADHE